MQISKNNPEKKIIEKNNIKRAIIYLNFLIMLFFFASSYLSLIVKKKMKTIFKFYLNLILRFFGLEIVSKDRQKISYSFDFDYQKYFGAHKKVLILDIGANKGQSINRFRSIFKNSTIHSFEPDPVSFDIMKKIWKIKKCIFNSKCS